MALHDMDNALEEAGIEITAIHGVSVGALSAAMYAQGDAYKLMDIWQSVRSGDVYRQAPWNIFADGKACLFDSAPLLDLLTRHVRADKLVADKSPLYIMATDWDAEVPITFSPKDTNPCDFLKALLASASPPVFFPHVSLGRWRLVDGGVVDNYMILDAVNMGAEILLVLMPRGWFPKKKDFHTIIDPLSDVTSVGSHSIFKRELLMVDLMNSVPGKRNIQICMVQPEAPPPWGLLDFDALGSLFDRKDVINLAYEAAKEKLSTLIAAQENTNGHTLRS